MCKLHLSAATYATRANTDKNPASYDVPSLNFQCTLLENFVNGKIHTPCYVLNEDDMEFGISKFKHALSRNFKNNIIGYSVKTNSLPYILYKIRDLGCFAEVVSSDEYELVKIIGFPLNRIIYNGPMKTKETFLEAIQNGAYVNIETKREIEWLRELPIEKAFGVGLRVNINVSKISQEDAKYDDDFGRFGFSDETSDFEDAIRQISSLPNINLSGIHIHRMSRLCQNIAQPLFS